MVRDPRRLDEDDVRVRPGRTKSRPRSKDRPTHEEAVAGFVTTVDRGRFTVQLADGTSVYEGAAIVLNSDDTDRVAAAVRDKYKIGWALLSAWTRIQTMLGRDDGIADRAIKVTLHT